MDNVFAPEDTEGTEVRKTPRMMTEWDEELEQEVTEGTESSAGGTT